MTEILQAMRSIRRSPGFALLAILMLALGIGISTAVFSVVNGVLLEPLRFPEPARIISLNTRSADRPGISPRITGGDFQDLRTSSKVFDAVSVYFGGEMGVEVAGSAEFTGIQWVNPEFFRIFGQNVPALTDSGAMVSAGFAARHFGAASRAVGRSIQVDNRAYTVESVIQGARFPADTEIWLPAPYVPENLNRTAFNYHAVARLKAGISVEQAQADLDRLSAALAASYPDSNRGRTLVAIGLRSE